MSMFSTMSEFVQTSFTTATNSLTTVEKTLDIANHYVSENHKRITKTQTTSCQLSVAAFNADVALQLAADEELAAQYKKVVEDW